MTRYQKVLKEYFTLTGVTALVDQVDFLQEATGDKNIAMISDLSDDQAKTILDELAQSDFKNVEQARKNTDAFEDRESRIESAQSVIPQSAPSAIDNYTTIEVYNSETGQLTTRTPQQQAKAHALYQRIKMVDALQWAMVKMLLDGDHHLDLGFKSKDDFYDKEFGLSRSQASRKLRAGEILLQVLPVQVDDSMQAVKQIEGLSADQAKNFYQLADLGTSKLYEMSKADDADYTEVLSDGVVKYKDGREIPLEDYARRTRNEVHVLVKDELDKYKARNKELLEQRQNAEAELEKKTKEIEEKEDQYKEAKDLELTYGPKQLHLKGHYDRVNRAWEKVREANKLLTKIELPDDAPDDLRELVVNLHRTVDGGRQTLYDNNTKFIRTAKEIFRPTATTSKGESHSPQVDDDGVIIED